MGAAAMLGVLRSTGKLRSGKRLQKGDQREQELNHHGLLVAAMIDPVHDL
jgi:hypothetical protein